jgi:hypothetical protein
MPVYRITEFTSPDMDKAIEFCETLREEVAAAQAESIDVISIGDGKGMVIAKYANMESMENATDINKQAFGKLVAGGHADGASISMTSGDVVFSF